MWDKFAWLLRCSESSRISSTELLFTTLQPKRKSEINDVTVFRCHLGDNLIFWAVNPKSLHVPKNAIRRRSPATYIFKIRLPATRGLLKRHGTSWSEVSLRETFFTNDHYNQAHKYWWLSLTFRQLRNEKRTSQTSAEDRAKVIHRWLLSVCNAQNPCVHWSYFVGAYFSCFIYISETLQVTSENCLAPDIRKPDWVRIVHTICQ